MALRARRLARDRPRDLLDGLPALCQPCKEIRRVVKLAAWRVREGQYTRLSITWRGSTVVYEIKRIRNPVNGVPGGELCCSPP